jgi:hypothetical protein
MDINWLPTVLAVLVIFLATVVHGIAGFDLAQVSIVCFIRYVGGAGTEIKEVMTCFSNGSSLKV